MKVRKHGPLVVSEPACSQQAHVSMRGRLVEGQPDQPGSTYRDGAVDARSLGVGAIVNETRRPQVIMALDWKRELDFVECLRSFEGDLKPVPTIEREVRVRQVFCRELRCRLLVTTSPSIAAASRAASAERRDAFADSLAEIPPIALSEETLPRLPRFRCRGRLPCLGP